MKPTKQPADVEKVTSDTISREVSPMDMTPADLEAMSELYAVLKIPERHTARETFALALRENLLAIIQKYAAKVDPKEAADLRQWAEADANPEGLADWLGPENGWDTVPAAKVEACLVKAARAYSERERKGAGLRCFCWPAGGEPVLALLDVPRADADKPDVRERIAKEGDPTTGWDVVLQAVDMRRPLPEACEVLLGLDGLKAMLSGFGWADLRLCLSKEAGANWLALLAGPWISARLERMRIKAYAVPLGIRPKANTKRGKWTPIPRALDMAAALAGPFSVDVDGETYAPEPGMAPDAVGRALRPRGLEVVPADWLGKPAQLTLALDLNAPPETVREYLIETAARTAHLAQLPNMCPKLLGFMFAAAPMSGRPVKGTLGDLARWMYPDWADGTGATVKPWKDRRQNKRDLQAIGAAFVAVKNLRLVETKANGIRHPYDLFSVDYDLSAAPDAELGFRLNPWLVERMQGGKGGGFFLLNMSRWLALGIQNPRLFPLALRVAAYWDRARVGGIYDPDRLAWIEADRLAWECNALPEGAAAYRARKTDSQADHVQLKRARANMEADLDTLRDAGLLGAYEKRKVYGHGFQVLPAPPADYPEACKRAAAAISKAAKRAGK